MHETPDIQIVETILALTISHFQTAYPGYDTAIDRTNLIEHVYEIFHNNIKIEEKLSCVEQMLKE